MVELRLLKERLQMLCGDEALRVQLTLERIGTVIQLDRHRTVIDLIRDRKR